MVKINIFSNGLFQNFHPRFLGKTSALLSNNLNHLKINKRGQSFKHGQKHLEQHTIFGTLQTLEQITDPGNLQPLELIYHGNINPNRLQPPCTRCTLGWLRAPNPAPVRRSTGIHGLLCHYWSVNMSDLAMQYYLNIAARDGLLFTPYESRCIFAREYDLLTNRFGA